MGLSTGFHKITKDRTLLVVTLSLLAAITITFALLPKGPRIRVLKYTIEQGRPIVFFKLEKAENSSVFQVSRETSCGRDDGFILTAPEYFEPAPDFWAPSEGKQPLHSTQNELGIIALPNVEWRLKVILRSERAHTYQHLRIIVACWKSIFQAPRTAFQNVIRLWNHPIEQFEAIESAPIRIAFSNEK